MFKSKHNRLISKIKKQLFASSYGKKAVVCLFAVGCLFAPLNVQAANSTITKANSDKAGTIFTQGVVHSIYADKAGKNVAFNNFSDFKLAKNEIANLYFKTSATASNQASTLINFVDSKIDIAGTVNAVKYLQDNKLNIGGNLYFISSQGMIIQNSGVINAGALNVFTPTENDYKALLDKININNPNAGVQALSKIEAGEYAINPEATIVVQGRINTTDGVNLQAGSININESSDTIVKSGIKTGVIDFSDLVNIKTEIKTLDAGLGTDLTATKTGNGDIVLKANKLSLNSNTTVESAGSVKLDVVNDFSNNGVVKAVENITVNSSAGFANNGELAADKGSIDVVAVGDINDNGTMVSGKDLSLTSTTGNINVNRAISAGGDISFDAANYLAINGEADIEAKGNVEITADNVTIYTDITAKESAEISADGVLYNNGNISAGADISLAAEELTNEGTITAAKGSIALSSDYDLVNRGTLTAGANVSLASTKGDIVNDGLITSDASTSIEADNGSIKIRKGINAGKKVKIKSKNDIDILDSIYAFDAVMLCSDFGEIETFSYMAAPVMLMSYNDSVEVVAEKSVALDVVSAKKTVALSSASGAIDVAEIHANAVELKTTTGNVEVDTLKANKAVIAAGDKKLELPANADKIKYNTITDIVKDIIGTIKDDDKPASGADVPHYDPEFDKEVQKYRDNIIANMQLNNELMSMANENGENKDTEQVQFTYFNRFHLYDLPPDTGDYESKEGTIVISENKALISSVEEKKIEKKAKS